MSKTLIFLFVCNLPMVGPPYDCEVKQRELPSEKVCQHVLGNVGRAGIVTIEGQTYRVLDGICRTFRET